MIPGLRPGGGGGGGGVIGFFIRAKKRSLVYSRVRASLGIHSEAVDFCFVGRPWRFSGPKPRIWKPHVRQRPPNRVSNKLNWGLWYMTSGPAHRSTARIRTLPMFYDQIDRLNVFWNSSHDCHLLLMAGVLIVIWYLGSSEGHQFVGE